MNASIVVVTKRYLLKVARLSVSAVAEESVKLQTAEREWDSTYRIVRMVVIAFAAVMSYPYVRSPVSEVFKDICIFLGVIVLLGPSSAIG